MHPVLQANESTKRIQQGESIEPCRQALLAEAAIGMLSTGTIQALFEQEGREIAHAATLIIRAILKDLKQMMRHRDAQSLG